MKKNGYTIVELIVVLVLVGVIYFTFIGKVSFAFKQDYKEELYKQFIDTVEKNTLIYAQKNQDFFGEEEEIYMTIKNLADLKLVTINEEGNVVDPRDEEKNLNNLRVKITRVKGNIKVKVLD